MTKVISNYLAELYGPDDQPDENDRWAQKSGRYHASATSNCPRKWHWQWKKDMDPPAPTSYPYFYLGNELEDFYGEALAHEYGADRVKQDVEFTIWLNDDVKLVGESDWVLFEEDAQRIDKVEHRADGSLAIYYEGDDNPFIPFDETPELGIERVFETKTTKDIGWKQKWGHDPAHKYQVMSYMHAFGGIPGSVVYIERNSLAEMHFEFDYDEHMWMDIKFRALSHHRGLENDELPDTDPITQRECRYCPFKQECQDVGGSIWK